MRSGMLDAPSHAAPSELPGLALTAPLIFGVPLTLGIIVKIGMGLAILGSAGPGLALLVDWAAAGLRSDQDRRSQ